MNEGHYRRLMGSAARGRAAAETTASHRRAGLSTRVLSRWAAGTTGEDEQWLWERWARWGAALAVATAMAALLLARLEPAPGYLADLVWSSPVAGALD